MTGLLLINLGTPDSPHPKDVRRYLRQFLSDPRVIDIPGWRRRLLLEAVILPRRPRQSGEAYRKIWTERGSPLLFHTADLAQEVQRLAGNDVVVTFAMRYREPAIDGQISKLLAREVDRIVVFPLYPQYSSAATGSSLEEVYRAAGRHPNVPPLHVVPPFYEHRAFIDAYAELIRPHLDGALDRVYFSFHGLPERQVRKSDPSRRHCLESPNCCEVVSTVNRSCYRAQCFATARAIATRLGLDERLWRIAFQSRLGRKPWIRPYTDELLVADARAGCRRALIVAPAFVADCLETLEELGIRAVESWRAAGGERLDVVPCLNSGRRWAEAVLEIARDSLGAERRTVPAEGRRA